MNIDFLQLPELHCKEKDFYLKAYAMKHASSLQKALNNPKIAHDVSHIPYPYEMKHAQMWIDSRSKVVSDSSERVDFVIIKVIEGVEIVMGSVAFIEMNKMASKRHLAQVSMWVASEFEGQGIATTALGMLIEFGFETLGLHKIHGYAHPENEGSIRVMEKVGMKHNATIPDDWVREIDGKEYLADSYICSIINPESHFKKLPADYRSRFNEK